MRNHLLLTFALFLQPIQAMACSSGGYYETNARDSIPLAYICAALLIIALAIRIIRNGRKLYIPILLALIISVPAMLELSRWGYGDCGIGLYQIMEYMPTAFFMLAIYELALLYIWKQRENKNT